KGRPGSNDRGGDTRYRKCIRVTASQSPNVICGEEIRQRCPDLPEERIDKESFAIPGVLPWSDYKRGQETLDAAQQCVSLDADWYAGRGLLLFPPEALSKAEALANALLGRPRRARAMGIDTGEGEAETVWCIIDELGIIELVAMKTPDTSEIPKQTL